MIALAILRPKTVKSILSKMKIDLFGAEWLASVDLVQRWLL